MVRSHSFGLLAITLCFVFCLCARADVSQDTAEDAVTEVKKLTDKAVDKAQYYDREAKYIMRTMEERKEKAESAAAEAEKAAKGNEEAIVIANKAKSELDNLISIYSGAEEKAQTAVDYTKDKLLKAHELYGRSKIRILPNEGSRENYSKVSESAANVKIAAQKLWEEIEMSKQLLDSARVAMYTVSDHAKKTKVAKHRVDAVVTFGKMKTLLSEAETDIAIIQQKKEEINSIVQEIEGHLNNASKDLILPINRFHTNAHGDLRRVTTLLREVQEVKQAMLQEKTNADNTLTTMESLTDENQVRQESRDVEHFAKRAAEELKKIKAALKDAKSYADNSNERKQDTLKTLVSNNSKPVTVKNKETKKPSQPIEDLTIKTTSEVTKVHKDMPSGQHLQEVTTKTTSEDTNKQKNTNPGQPLQDVTTKPMTSDTSGQSIAKPSQPVQGAETKPTTEDTKEQNNTNQGQPETDGTKQTSEETAGQSDAKPSQPLQDAGTKPTSEDTTGKNDTNTSEHFQDVTTKPTSEDTKEEKETKAGQYATKRANSTGTKGIVFPYDTINDGAITASFSLLLAVIACAALN